MKKFVALVGFCGGVVIALILLLRSPLAPQTLTLPSATAVLQWQTLEFAGNPFTPSSLLGLPAGSGVVPIGASQVDLANATIMLLFDETGQPVALATQLASRRKGGNLLLGNVGIDTYTNVLWPNRGSVMMHGYEDRTPMLRASALGNTSTSAEDADIVSAVAPVDPAGGIVGGSGELLASGGSFSESLWKSAEQPGVYTGTLTIELTAGK